MQDSEEFSVWLENVGYAPRVRKDILSRCKRIETYLGKEIEILIRGPQAYLNAVSAIKKVSYETTGHDLKKFNALSGNLTLALRKYAEFKLGSKFDSYPRPPRVSFSR